MDKTRQVRGCVRVRVCVRACVRVSARGRGACEGMTIETPRIHASSLHLVQVCVSLEDSCDTSYRMTVHDEVAVGGPRSPCQPTVAVAAGPPEPSPAPLLVIQVGSVGGGEVAIISRRA